MKNIILLFIAAAIGLHAASQSTRIIIQFTNKNGTPFTISNPSAYLSARAIQRRVNYNIAIDSTDLPCNPNYIASVKAQGNVTVLSQSKWLNQILIRVSDPATLNNIRSLPFVKSAQSIAPRVGVFKDKFEKVEPAAAITRRTAKIADYYNYGNSYDQVHIHEGEFLHNKGYRGQNMIITVLDAGFNQYRTITAFDSVRMRGQILGEKDFVDYDNSVNEDNQHGMQCLSIMAANWPGRMVGTAPAANYWLVRTEDANSEYPVEEHNWVAGAEFADSAGTDMISSSLGYTTFDSAYYNHTYSQFYKNAAIVTMGATLAAKKGIIVTNSAGNDGDGGWKYLSFPADADSVCAVGSVSATGAISSFSSYGYPGKVKPNIVSLGQNTTIAGSTEPVSGSGTSFSNPNIAGLIACLWQAFPRFSNMKVLDALYKSADRYANPTDHYGFGIPNMKVAYRLLKKDENTILYGNDWYFAGPDNFIDTVAALFIGQADGNARVDVLNASGTVVATQAFTTEKEEVYKYVFRSLGGLPPGLYSFQYTDGITTRSIQLRKAGALPVNDLVVKAFWLPNAAVINWSVSQEINTANYVIERSVNGTDFKEIGNILSRGNTLFTANYLFEDKEAATLQSATIYYRLKIIDNDGRQQYSNVIKLQSIAAVISMVINPNPARDVVTLTITTANAANAVIEISNGNGQIIKKQTNILVKGSNTLRLRLTGIAKGEYFIKLTTELKVLQGRLVVL